jgi:hypothetical protein
MGGGGRVATHIEHAATMKAQLSVQARGMERGIKYDRAADEQSWAAMLRVFGETYR